MPRYQIPSPEPVEPAVVSRYTTSGPGEVCPVSCFIELDGGTHATAQAARLIYVELRFDGRTSPATSQFIGYFNRPALRALRDAISSALASAHTPQPQAAPNLPPRRPRPLAEIFRRTEPSITFNWTVTAPGDSTFTGRTPPPNPATELP